MKHKNKSKGTGMRRDAVRANRGKRQRVGSKSDNVAAKSSHDSSLLNAIRGQGIGNKNIKVV